MDSTASLEEGFAAVLSRAEALAADAAQLRKAARLLSRPEGYESLHRVRRLLDRLDGSPALPEDLRASAEAAGRPVRDWLAAEWARRAHGVAAETVEHFAGRGVAASVDGLVIGAPPLTLRIEAEKDRASVEYAGEAVIGNAPLVPQRLFAAWQAAQARLRRDEVPPELFGDALIAAYGRVAPRAGARVPLPDLHFDLFVGRQTAQVKSSPQAGKIKEYPRFQFAWDLARLIEAPAFLQRGERRIEIFEASPSAARSRTGSVLVPGVAGGLRAWGDLRVG
jgi:hypothetical protein